LLLLLLFILLRLSPETFGYTLIFLQITLEDPWLERTAELVWIFVTFMPYLLSVLYRWLKTSLTHSKLKRQNHQQEWDIIILTWRISGLQKRFSLTFSLKHVVSVTELMGLVHQLLLQPSIWEHLATCISGSYILRILYTEYGIFFCMQVNVKWRTQANVILKLISAYLSHTFLMPCPKFSHLLTLFLTSK